MEPTESSQVASGDGPTGRNRILYVVTADYGLNGHELIRVSFGRPTPLWLGNRDTACRSVTGYNGLRVHEVEIVSHVSIGKVRPDDGF
jgi:hypothetical protein